MSIGSLQRAPPKSRRGGWGAIWHWSQSHAQHTWGIYYFHSTFLCVIWWRTVTLRKSCSTNGSVQSIFHPWSRLKTWTSRCWTSGGNSRGLISAVFVCPLMPSFARCWAPSTRSPWTSGPTSNLSRKRTLRRFVQKAWKNNKIKWCTHNKIKSVHALSKSKDALRVFKIAVKFQV